ncbi:uncharacterized protein TNCV_1463561 [Trichonephila clavipes]|uniref:Uncharacterized protein n=1 Tax=Trichonephila clavipes TaxID=2585209 RepID=A0A8X6SJW0_TRICX|nr:uncharacterized protein TNCV_1463561 [Trichonephila clavipes]
MLHYNSSVRVNVILLENSQLNAVDEWQYYGLNYQTDVQICSQCVRDNHESTPAIIGNCSSDHDSRCRFSVSWLQTLSWPPDQHAAITGNNTEPAFIRKHNKSPLRPPIG